MLPIYTRELTTADYGTYELLAITTTILGILLGAGIRSAVIRFHKRYASQREKDLVVSTAGLFISLLMGSVLILLLIAARG